jgi:hypothetical protein
MSVSIKKSIIGSSYKTVEIVDTRSIAGKTGENWLVRCMNLDHQEMAEYFYSYAEANEFAKTALQTIMCPECLAGKIEDERQYKIKDLSYTLAKRYDYLDKAEFVWMNDGAYSGGRHGGANNISVGFGIEGRSFYGAQVTGEARVVISADGVPTIVYAYETWSKDEGRGFVEFTDFEEFKSAMMEMLAPREKQFTKNSLEVVAQMKSKLIGLGLSESEIMVEVSNWKVGA